MSPLSVDKHLLPYSVAIAAVLLLIVVASIHHLPSSHLVIVPFPALSAYSLTRATSNPQLCSNSADYFRIAALPTVVAPLAASVGKLALS